jgi:hypothetical protein
VNFKRLFKLTVVGDNFPIVVTRFLHRICIIPEKTIPGRQDTLFYIDVLRRSKDLDTISVLQGKYTKLII